MTANYRTVLQEGQCEIIINKSRFLAYVQRAESEQQALDFIGKVKKKHWDATHNCSAYLVGKQEENQKADDDGEPSGTAGKPILEVIKKAQITDTVIVITRYFGGIKLGAGGLIRAYGKAASTGLKAAGLVDRVIHMQIAVEIDYTAQGFVENQLRNQGFIIQQKQFTHKVTMQVLVPLGDEEEFEKKVQDWTAGMASFKQLGETFLDVPVPEE